MKRTWLIIINIVLWGVIAAYMIGGSGYTSRRRSEVVCGKINVEVKDSRERDFITPDMVRIWLSTGEMNLMGRPMGDINTREIEKFINRRGYVKQARVYTSMDGSVNVELTQRAPVIRFNMSDGYNFYLTDDGFIVPAQKHAVDYVPLVTGRCDFPFPKDYIGYYRESIEDEEKKMSKNYLFFSNLTNFVKFVSESDFWNSFIVQIYISQSANGQPQLEIVPRLEGHVVILGSLEKYREKLDALMSFYRGASAYEGWNKYKYIDLTYDGQIVCM